MDHLEKYSLLHFILKESVTKRVGKNIIFKSQNWYYRTEDTNEIVNIGLSAKSKYGDVIGYNSNLDLINKPYIVTIFVAPY